MENYKRDIKKHWYVTNRSLIYWLPIKKSETRKLLAEEKKKVKEYNKELRKEQRKNRFLNKRDNSIYQSIFKDHYWEIKSCMICWGNEWLQIHHKDKNWRNNNIDNLIMLCRDCHAKAHNEDKYVMLIAKGWNRVVVD